MRKESNGPLKSWNDRITSLLPWFRRATPLLTPHQAEAPERENSSYELLCDIDNAHEPYLLPVRTLDELFPGISESSVQLPANRIMREHLMVLPVTELLCIGAICRHINPRSVFEIGTYSGATTLVMAINAPGAELHTLDLPPADIAASTKIGRHFRDGPHAPRIRQHLGNSATFNFAPFDEQLDLVFVDADHTYEAVRRDTENALRLVRPGGLIIWDDYRWEEEWSECAGVTRCLNEIAAVRPVFALAGTRLAIHKVPS